jgi:hypothetical protein
MMQKTIDEAINETADKLLKVLNESGLPLAVIKLILNNMLLSIQQIPQVPTESEEAKDAEN